MTSNPSLRDALISSSRTHAETDLHRFSHSRHTGNVAIAAAGLLLAWLLLPRRSKFIGTAMLTAAGVFATRDWLREIVAPSLSGAGRYQEPEGFEEPMPELNDSLVDLQSHQSFPASDAPAGR